MCGVYIQSDQRRPYATPTEFAALCVLLIAAGHDVYGADKLKAGEEGKLEISGNSHPSVIYIPKDYKDGMKLPLILFMHGAGGSPTTWPFKSDQ